MHSERSGRKRGRGTDRGRDRDRDRDRDNRDRRQRQRDSVRARKGFAKGLQRVREGPEARDSQVHIGDWGGFTRHSCQLCQSTDRETTIQRYSNVVFC